MAIRRVFHPDMDASSSWYSKKWDVIIEVLEEQKLIGRVLEMNPGRS